jgi:hypothetical protein
MKNLKLALIETLRRLLGHTHLKLARESLLNIEIQSIKDEIRRRDPDAFVLHGRKVYSQGDEDGIIERIFGKIGEKTRVFVEAGCGNGLENNTHCLFLKGWRGAWIDGDAGNVAFIRAQLEYQPNPLLSLSQSFITAENVNTVVEAALRNIALTEFPAEIDLFVLDIDGNDLYVLEALEAVKPRVLCVEYNAKFPPPMRIAIEYQPTHEYGGDDYQGASLQSLVDLLEPRGYRLVACSLSGVNAFFVRSSEIAALPLGDAYSLYQPPRHRLTASHPGLAPSLKYARDRIAKAKAGGG